MHVNRRIGTAWMLGVDLDEFLYPAGALGALIARAAQDPAQNLQGLSVGSATVKIKDSSDYARVLENGIESLPRGRPSCHGGADPSMCIGPPGHRKILVNVSMAPVLATHETNYGQLGKVSVPMHARTCACAHGLC